MSSVEIRRRVEDLERRLAEEDATRAALASELETLRRNETEDKVVQARHAAAQLLPSLKRWLIKSVTCCTGKRRV